MAPLLSPAGCGAAGPCAAACTRLPPPPPPLPAVSSDSRDASPGVPAGGAAAGAAAAAAGGGGGGEGLGDSRARRGVLGCAGAAAGLTGPPVSAAASKLRTPARAVVAALVSALRLLLSVCETKLHRRELVSLSRNETVRRVYE